MALFKRQHVEQKLHKDLLIVADTCLCEYTDHGHCGIIDDHTHDVDNENLPLLVKQQFLKSKLALTLLLQVI